MEEEIVESIKNNNVPLRKNEEEYDERIVETMEIIEEIDQRDKKDFFKAALKFNKVIYLQLKKIEKTNCLVPETQLPIYHKIPKNTDGDPTIEDIFIDENAEIFNNDDLKEDDKKFSEELLKNPNFSEIGNFDYNKNNKTKSETKIELDLNFQDVLMPDVEMSE